MAGKYLIASALAALLMGAIPWSHSDITEARHSALSHQAYLWQRAWTGAVGNAVRQRPGRLTRLVVLAGELTLSGPSPRMVRVPLNYATLRNSATAIGLALRIGTYGGPFDRGNRVTALITRLAGAIIARARAQGVAPEEFQVDFDCPESKLEGYRSWLKALRRKIAPIPLTITALPCWLGRKAFRRLIGETDGFVLQVHALVRRRPAGNLPTIFAPRAALRAVDRAARLGKSFRVALPTYGYRVAHDGMGRLQALQAEGPARAPGPLRYGYVNSDPAAAAALIRRWTGKRPRHLSGIIWFRLPVSTDRLNWRRPTLEAVMSGRTPRPLLEARVKRTEAGLVELTLANRGEADAEKAVTVQVHWQDARLIAADGLGGYKVQDRDAEGLDFRPAPDSPPPPLRPGESRAIGWLRLDRDREVKVHVY